jgi:hypothetical protein
VPALGVIGNRLFPATGNNPLDNSTISRIMKLSLVLAGLFLMDILTTQSILSQGGVELNPAMAGSVNNPVLHLAVKSSVFLLVLAVALLAEAKVKGSSTKLYSVLFLMYLFVILNNTCILFPHFSV